MSKLFLFIILIILVISLGYFVFMKDKKNLSYFVTKEGGTEPAFDNEYWDEKRPGIYVGYNSGEALFSSLDKYDSGTGWPSFTKPIDESMIKREDDNTLGMKRIEIKTDQSHLGHVFPDGPDGGERFCVNSASLKFISYENLEKEGYAEYRQIFPYETAIFAGGCFWGIEHLFEKQSGVISAISGYSGGDKEDPSYREVVRGNTGHYESVYVIFDPNIVSYRELVDLFWRMHDPTQENGQGVDIGSQYLSAIFYFDEDQKQIAEESKKEFNDKKIFNKPAITKIAPYSNFYSAEDYHQDYVDKNPSYVCHSLRSK